jgi:prepilin peptidase CpaA
MSPRIVLIALIGLVGLAAVVEDIGWRRISNWTSGGAVAGGLLLHLLQTGWSGFWHSVLGAVLGFGVFLVFYVLGGMGGGDVKLMAGFGALLGNGQILQAALLAAFCGGVMAMVLLAARGARRGWLRLFHLSKPAATAQAGYGQAHGGDRAGEAGAAAASGRQQGHRRSALGRVASLAASGDSLPQKSRESIPYAPAITAGAWLALIAEM